MSAQVSPVVEDDSISKKPDPNSKKLKKAQWQRDLAFFMNSSGAQVFLGVLLMISLFMPDAWIIGNAPDEANIGIDIILILVFFFFSMESIILSIATDNYIYSFFFWCDIAGTISILLDINMFMDHFEGNGTSGSTPGLLRAARAAKVGARYGRLMRLMKLMKFMDYLPCLKKPDEEAFEPTMSAAQRLSNQLSGVLSRRVAALVLLLVIVVPLLSYDMYFSNDDEFETMGQAIYVLGVGGNCNTNKQIMDDIGEAFESRFDSRDKKLCSYTVECTTAGDTLSYTREFIDPDTVRKSNLVYWEYEKSTIKVFGQIDRTVVNQYNSMFGMLLIILVIVVLIGFSASFQNAIDLLVVAPLEKMMTTLRTSAAAILKSVAAIDEVDDSHAIAGDEDLDDELETAMLEKMIEKLARIAQHVMPGTQSLVIRDGDQVDSATASWLNQNYSKSSGVTEHKKGKGMYTFDKSLQNLKSGINVSLINSWDFDVLDYTHNQLFEVYQYIFSVLGFFDTYKIAVPVFESFLLTMSKLYIAENTYHNFFHGCDVAHTTYRLISISEMDKVLQPIEVFALIVAALAHDVGHPGTNNAFLVKAKDPLALLYNDRSPLENMHCSSLYNVLKDPTKNIFSELDEQQWRDARKSITTTILGTDMVHHFDQISRVQIFLEVNGLDIRNFLSGKSENIECMKDNDQKLFIMEVILHAADISNPYKPFKICERWANLVVEEFYSQGDKEKANGFPISAMMDRSSPNMNNMQMGFIEFVVAPFVNGIINIFPPLHEAGTYMMGNFLSWGDYRRKEISNDAKIADKEGEIKKLDERMDKFRDKMSFINDLKEFEAERAK